MTSFQLSLPTAYVCLSLEIIPSSDGLFIHLFISEAKMLNQITFLLVVLSYCHAQLIFNNILPGGTPDSHQSVTFTKPWFCHDLDCPKYSVLETNDVSFKCYVHTCKAGKSVKNVCLPWQNVSTENRQDLLLRGKYFSFEYRIFPKAFTLVVKCKSNRKL